MAKYESIIIGGGPAGLTAGMYACRAGLKVLLIERAMFGGQVINAQKIENYPGFPDGISGFDLATFMQQQALKYGLEVINNIVTSVKLGKPHVVITPEIEYETDTVIIVTGSQYSKLGIEGDEQYLGRGVSYCATCDGFMFRDKDVAVVGGGDTALSDALELCQHSSAVYLIHRRDQLRASQILQDRAFAEPKMKFIWNTMLEKITGDKFLNMLYLNNVKTGEKSSLPVSGVFIAVGLKPNSDIFKDILKIDPTGLIETDMKMATSVDGIFAAGDVRRYSPRQVSTAVGDGATAALSAYRYLRQ